MKLGVAGLLGDGTVADVCRVRAMGFATASWHLRDLEIAGNAARLGETREILESEGLELCQLLPPHYPSLVDPEPAVRAAGVEALRRVIDAAVVLGAGNVYVRPGSLNPAGAWTPHPRNHDPGTRGRLVESLRALAPHAEAAGMLLAVEGHVVSPLHTPEVVREVLDAAGSPALRFNADPVNFLGTLDDAFAPRPVVDRLFDLLGDRVVIAHAKDVTVGSRLVAHVEECVPGTGYLDLAHFLRRFAACCPEGAVLIEHLPAEQVPAARQSLLAASHHRDTETQRGTEGEPGERVSG